ncbi:MAG: proton-conducting transporter membrane subunit, partial [Alphaproteobacteria bacterium]
MSVIIALTPVMAEIWLALAGMALLMFGVFRGHGATRSIAGLTIVVFVVAFVASVGPASAPVTALGGLFVVDAFAVFMKGLVLTGAALTLILSLGYIRRENMERFEFPVLVLFATLGMMMMVSANDLIALYMGLELQSLSLYVVAAFQRDSQRSTEAGLKYFVLGAL